MARRWTIGLLAGVGLCCVMLARPTAAQPVPGEAEWTREQGIQLTTRWRPVAERPGVTTDRITADLYRPRQPGRVPAAVIINSSGGVTAYTEHYYARVLAGQGVASLVIDSFGPRGARSTVTDQAQVPQSRHYADAGTGFRYLAGREDIDAARIIVLGMSRGALAALAAATHTDRQRLDLTDTRFAAHVAIAPGCGFQPRDPATTGAPIFFILSELDDYTPIGPCLEYAQRIAATANAQVRLAVYPGVFHAQENIGGIATLRAESGPRCSFFRDANWRLFDRTAARRPVPPDQERAFLLSTCLGQRQVTIGGDPRVKAQLTADLLQFLRDTDVIEDGQARAVVPDCTTVPDGPLRRNCARARAGWTGDMVALARGFRAGGQLRDDAAVLRLFRLAADRGHPQAQWELALMLRDGTGTARNIEAARELLAKAVDGGEPPAMNLLGVMARDGVGQPRDDAAAFAWFQRAAGLGHAGGQANLGRFHWQGRGGAAQDDAAAVALWRQAAAAGHAWGTVFLAEALETGRGTPVDRAQAIALNRRAAAQTGDAAAARQALAALTRLGAG